MKNCKKAGIVIHGDFIIGLPGETKETIEKTIDYAKELDCETIQVSLAHAFPGTELYAQAAQNGFLATEALTDSGGHQLPHLEYPGLTREDMVESRQPFLRRILLPSTSGVAHRSRVLVGYHERKRLYHEAVSFLRLRYERWKLARRGIDKKPPWFSVPPVPRERSVGVASETNSA